VSGAQTTSNVNIAVVAGVSAEFTLSKHLALHTAYRAQAFKAPDFTYNGSTIPLSAKTFLSNEPSIGIAYRFNPK
jgi:opacity protein-like surface antigen